MKCERCNKNYPSKYYFSTPALCKECFQSIQLESKEHKAMDCPECKNKLIEKRDYGITIDESEKCKGIWFDVGELFDCLIVESLNC